MLCGLGNEGKRSRDGRVVETFCKRGCWSVSFVESFEERGGRAVLLILTLIPLRDVGLPQMTVAVLERCLSEVIPTSIAHREKGAAKTESPKRRRVQKGIVPDQETLLVAMLM